MTKEEAQDLIDVFHLLVIRSVKEENFRARGSSEKTERDLKKAYERLLAALLRKDGGA